MYIKKITCKLYLFDKEVSSWKNLGLVNLHINEYVMKENNDENLNNENKSYTRIGIDFFIKKLINLVARLQNSHRVILNFKIWPLMSIDMPSDNTILTQAINIENSENVRLISFTVIFLIIYITFRLNRLNLMKFLNYYKLVLLN